MQTQTEMNDKYRKINKAKGKRATASTSKAVKDAVAKRTFIKPVIVKGIGPGKLITVTQSMFGRLDVDPSYQRGETRMVNKIIRVIDAGGLITDPVTLCKRKGDDSGKYWIVDGHQRVCAFQERKQPFSAILHESDDADAEHNLFIALNIKNAVQPNVLIKASNAKTADMIRAAGASLEHPLSERINFEQYQNANRYEASTIARGMAAAMGIAASSKNAPDLMSRLDAEFLRSDLQKKRAEAYLRLLGAVSMVDGKFKKFSSMVMRALGFVAHKRWERGVTMPDKRVINRLHKKNWEGAVLMVEKYFPVLMAEVEKVWKGGE